MANRLQRGIIIIPSALTLGNLFFGIWAIVSATRGQFEMAAWLIVLAGVADMLDGRVARVTKTGSRFGEELDSLVDAISFGLAPSLIVYFLFLVDGSWGWIAAFFYTSGTVIRLARFNVEQAGHAKVAFHGLPSPSAGITLATFYPFSQTEFFKSYLATLPWPNIMIGLMIVLALLMMSHVLYPVVPKFGFRSARGIVTFILMIAAVVGLFTVPALIAFPLIFAYVTFGVVRSLVLGYFDKLPDRDPMLDSEGGDEAGAELRDIDYAQLAPRNRFKSRWRGPARPEEESAD
jgi:CDP-diacylglycerol--serine O-phosphatidyltransferase